MRIGTPSRFLLAACALLILVSASARAQQYIISTIVGGAPPPTPVAGVSASIGQPLGVATDSAGNLYFSSLNCVFKLDQKGVLTRVAGNSRPGYSGDGGAATNASLYSSSSGVAVDSAGNLYLADSANYRVRKVSPAGIITTVAGNGTSGYSGDGGPAASAQLNGPAGVAMDSTGNLYIADWGNNCLRKVSAAGIITTVAGNGTAGYSGDGGLATSAQLVGPSRIAVDSAGNLYMVDNFRVRKVSRAGIINTVAGNGTAGYSGDGGPATSAQLSAPTGVAMDSLGNLYIADWGNNCVRKVSAAGIITTVAGNGTAGYSGDGGPAISARLSSPQGIAADSAGNLYVSDGGNGRVRKISAAGIISTVAGNGSYEGYSGDGGPATSAQLLYPAGLAVDSAGNLYIADTSNNRVRKVSAAGIITTAAGNGVAGYSGDGGPAASAQLNRPTGVAADSAGNLYIADCWNQRVRKVSAAGIIATAAGNGSAGYFGDGTPATSFALNSPFGVAADSAGNLYIADSGNNRIRKVSTTGSITTIAGTWSLSLGGSYGGSYSGDGGPATSAHLNSPHGVAVDGAGNIYLVDSGNQRVRKISPDGIITTVAGNGIASYFDGVPAISAMLHYPMGVAVDSAGNLYIADSANYRVRKVSPDGMMATIAGSRMHGYSGDGGPAIIAQLDEPSGVAVDSAGNVYVADSNNNAIRLLQPARGAPPEINANGAVEGAGYRRVLSAGGIASLFGTNLASGATSATTFPVPVSLSGTSVIVEGKAAPLFYVSPTQINFQIPWELSGQVPALIVVATPAGASVYGYGLSPVSPGIFTLDSSGSGQGMVTVASTGQLAAPATPARRGQYVSIYCSGLGPVSNAPATGAAAAASPLSSTLLIPTVTIGGVQTTTSFSGLAPFWVGLYQVNALVPYTTTPGLAVQLALSINGVSSNTVTIAVQ